MPRSSRPLVLGVVIAICLAIASPATYADAAPRPTRHLDPRQILHRAEKALDHVQEIFAAGAQGQGNGDPTIALRNLAATKAALPASERRLAERYLARPSGGGRYGCSGDYACYKKGAHQYRLCDRRICVHYVRHGKGAGFDNTNGVDPEDNGTGGRWSGRARNGVPDMVESTLKQLTHIDSTYLKAGYRSTRRDGRQGGDARRDIYLANVGVKGLYGYCTSDDPKLNRDPYATTHPMVSAYCVLDNDFSHAEFPEHSPRQNLEVTAAHEYFHAVQFAYDFDEDSWMMEATATWAEDQLYTKINDNRQYLSEGPLGQPAESLDLFQSGGVHQYGTWIFFRYLTEHLTQAQAHLPVLVRRIWQLSIGKNGYSIAAIKAALAEKHTTLDAQLANFVVANRRPGAFYREGGAYRPSPLAGTATLAAGGHFTDSPSLPHLASATYRVTPGAGATSLAVNPTAAGPDVEAAVVVHTKAGAYVRSTVEANTGGSTVSFDPATVAWVEVSLINAGSSYSCWNRSSAPWQYTCQGTSTNDSSHPSVTLTAS